MTAAEFRQWWSDQAADEPFFGRLNAHYAGLEAGPSGFEHVGSFPFGDIIAVMDFPAAGYSTLLTKGLSGFHLRTHSDEHDLIRVELAWTLKRDSVSEATAHLLAAVADHLLQQRRCFHQHEVFAFDFSGLAFPNRLTHFMASNGYWFTQGLERLDADIPMYVFELFSLTAEEAGAASRDVESFAEYVDGHGIEIENLHR